MLEQKDGSVLIVLGDVSGKGLKAAMTVSLIVGALRTFTEYTQEPVEILRGLNRRLIGRGEGGLPPASCCVLNPVAWRRLGRCRPSGALSRW